MISNSVNFIWSEKDVLGTGATSTVYTGRSKSQGLKVAVKVFNNSSFMRPGEVQDREFEVLRQLKHRNVVQLLAIDVDERSRQRVIVMELCSKGSLYTMLDQPQYMFGVPEQEYKRILADICCGMKYLKNKQIVHRDLKPGNIMVLEDRDGQNIYKLADFGAARQLSNDENFVSLYGTEEYLHPDMYARALLREMSGSGFNSTVDLWSLGVTLYHVATGSLPFKPYGGRNNKKTMHFLTTKKKSGVICGIQKDSVDGPITWERELPKTSQMSTMFKRMLTPLLAGLLECDQTKMMSAEKFFEEVDRMLDMKIFDVFDVLTARMLKIYLHREDRFDKMKEHVEDLSGINIQDQMLMFQQRRFNPSTLCKQFPSTSENEPMVLFSKTLQRMTPIESKIMPIHKPEFPGMSSNSHPDMDYSYSKVSAGVMSYRKQALEETLNAQHAFTIARTYLSSIIADDLRRVDRQMADVVSVKVKVVTNLEALKNHLNFVHTLEGILPVNENELGHGNSMKITEIEGLVKEIQEDHDGKISELIALNVELEDQVNPFEVTTSLCCDPGQRCVERFQVNLNSVFESLEIFKNNRRSKHRESPSILRLEKLRLRDFCEDAKSYQNGHCEAKLMDMYTKFSDWYRVSRMMLGKIETIAEKVDWFKMKYSDLQHNIVKVMKDLEKKQAVLLSNFTNLTTKESEYSTLSTASSTSSGSQPSLASDFEVIANTPSIPEEDEHGGHVIPFLPAFLQPKAKAPGRQVTVKKNMKQHIIKGSRKEGHQDALIESMKLLETLTTLEKESASLFSTATISTPPTDDLN